MIHWFSDETVDLFLIDIHLAIKIEISQPTISQQK